VDRGRTKIREKPGPGRFCFGSTNRPGGADVPRRRPRGTAPLRRGSTAPSPNFRAPVRVSLTTLEIRETAPSQFADDGAGNGLEWSPPFCPAPFTAFGEKNGPETPLEQARTSACPEQAPESPPPPPPTTRGRHPENKISDVENPGLRPFEEAGPRLRRARKSPPASLGFLRGGRKPPVNEKFFVLSFPKR